MEISDVWMKARLAVILVVVLVLLALVSDMVGASAGDKVIFENEIYLNPYEHSTDGNWGELTEKTPWDNWDYLVVHIDMEWQGQFDCSCEEEDGCLVYNLRRLGFAGGCDGEAMVYPWDGEKHEDEWWYIGLECTGVNNMHCFEQPKWVLNCTLVYCTEKLDEAHVELGEMFATDGVIPNNPECWTVRRYGKVIASNDWETTIATESSHLENNVFGIEPESGSVVSGEDLVTASFYVRAGVTKLRVLVNGDVTGELEQYFESDQQLSAVVYPDDLQVGSNTVRIEGYRGGEWSGESVTWEVEPPDASEIAVGDGVIWWEPHCEDYIEIKGIAKPEEGDDFRVMVWDGVPGPDTPFHWLSPEVDGDGYFDTLVEHVAVKRWAHLDYSDAEGLATWRTVDEVEIEPTVDTMPIFPGPPDSPDEVGTLEAITRTLERAIWFIRQPFLFLVNIIETIINGFEQVFGASTQLVGTVFGFLPQPIIAITVTGVALGLFLRVVGR